MRESERLSEIRVTKLPQQVIREAERVERIVVAAEQRQRLSAPPRRFKLRFAFRMPGEMIEQPQRLIRVLGGASAQVRHLATRIDRHAEIIQVRQVQRLFIGGRPFLYTGVVVSELWSKGWDGAVPNDINSNPKPSLASG